MVEFDLILEKMGSLSPRQTIQIILLLIPCSLTALQMGAMVYLGADIDKQCTLPFKEGITQTCNVTWGEEQATKAVPWDHKIERPSTCSRFQFPQNGINCSFWWSTNYSDTNSSVFIWKSSISIPVVPCTSWVYDNTSLFKSTVVNDFDLVCTDTYKRHFAQSIYMLGITVGCVLWGYISDRSGRKPAFVAATLLGTLFAIATAFSNSYPLFVVLRTLSGCCLFSLYTTAFVIMMEIVAPTYRVRYAQTAQASYAFGFCLLAVAGYFVRDWRKLQLVISVPVAGFLLYHWVILESPRWLLSNNRFADAYSVTKKLFNKRKTDIEELKTLQEAAEDDTDRDEKKTFQQDQSHGPLTLLKTPNIRSKSLKLFYCWLVCACVYYGLTLNSADIGGDPFINLALSGFVEIPAVFLIIPSLEKWGRRPTLSFSLVLSGCACITMLFVPKDLLSINIFLSMLGKFAIAAAFATVYIYAAELYPTPIRNVGIGVCSSMARVGGIISPFIAMFGDLATYLPYVIFGVMSLVGGITALFLPEVLGIRLPETIEEGEEFGLDQDGPLDFLIRKIPCTNGASSPSYKMKCAHAAVPFSEKRASERV